MPAALADTTLRLLEDLPPFERNSKDIQGTVDVLAREIDRIDAAREQVRANFFPQTADILLSVYENELGLSVAPPDKTLEQRRTSVSAFMQKLRSTGTGLDWQDNLTRLIGTGWTYREHDPSDPTSPPANTITVNIPFTTAIAPPTGLAGTPSAGGTLAAGTYYYAVSAINFYGETTISAPVSVVVGASGQVALDWADVAGASGYGVFRGTSAGSLHRLANPTTSAYTDTGAVVPSGSPPATNTTESFQAYEAQMLARKITPAHIDLLFTYGAGFILGVGRLGIDHL